MRNVAFLVALALVLTACVPKAEPPQPQAPPPPVAEASPPVTEAPLPLKPAPGMVTYRVLAGEQEVPSQGAFGLFRSDALTLTLLFSEPMDRASSEAAVRRSMPSAGEMTWQDDLTLLIQVPEGGPFEVDASGADSADGKKVSIGVRRTIERPLLKTVSFYRLADLLAGKTEPAYRHRVEQYTEAVRVSPDGSTALLYGPDLWVPSIPPTLLDLPTGKLTVLGMPQKNYTYGGWLPDGRLLLAGHEVFVGGPRGEDMKSLTPGSFSWLTVLSPTGRYLAQWGPLASGVPIIDLQTGETRTVTGPFRRCAQDGGVTLAWSPDGNLLAGTDCDSDVGMASPRIRIIDPIKGEQVRTIEGYWLRDWQPSGHLLAGTRSEEDVMYRLDPAGNRVGNYRGYGSPSPDGRYLILHRREGTGPYSYYLLEEATGREMPLTIPGYPQWASSDYIVVID